MPDNNALPGAAEDRAAGGAADDTADAAANRAANGAASKAADAAAHATPLAAAQAFLPFALPDIGDEEIAAVVNCLRSGWVTTGPKARQFESEFAAYLGGGVDAMAVNSATAGLHLALEALGIGPGDEVIVPTMTFTATAEVVRYLGAQPVLVDVAPGTLNLDADCVERALTPRTRAIIPVHYAGLACDMDRLLPLARAHGLSVVEDAAHAFPTRYKGRLIGTLQSDATVFSFYANKTMTTGEGGMVVTRNPQLAQRVKVMRLHGISQDAFARYTSRAPAWFYEVVAAGFKYNLTDLAAAIGIEQLRKIDQFLARRVQLADAYRTGLARLPLHLPAEPGVADSQGIASADICNHNLGHSSERALDRTLNGTPASTHAWHLYPVRLHTDAAVQRDELIAQLAERGIGTSVHFIPLHRHPYWRDSCRLDAADFPVAEASFASMLTLPLYTRMRDADQQRVIGALHELLT